MVFPCLYAALLVLLAAGADSQIADRVCLLVPESTQACFRKFEGKPIRSVFAQINCLQDLFWNFESDMSLNQRDRAYLRNITNNHIPSAGSKSIPRALSQRLLYPLSGHRTRKEYRLLTRNERERFHRALKRMYMDGYIDTFAKVHAQAANIHHGGASFLPWHRIFLLMFEEALRLYDSTVSLPYWASKLDNDMDNPVNSMLWTSGYFGNGEGAVTSGPAAYWVTDQGSLERNIGKDSRLLATSQINTVMSQCRLANISRPTASADYDFEFYHGGPHVWVGGDMSSLAKTGYDPVFYMHHAYIDYIWERFRRRQRVLCGVEPSTDYPDVPLGDSNHPDAPMTGFEWFTNKDGIKPEWTDNWYTYEREPMCPNCCPKCYQPAPLYCDRRRNVCVPRSKLVDPSGAIVRDIVVAMASRSKSHEAMLMPARNRGQSFDAPPSDGRTVFTAVNDAMKMAASNSLQPPPQPFF